MKKRYQTSFVIDKKLWIKFKSKTIKNGESIKDVLHVLIDEYVRKEQSNGSSWFSLSRWK